jgi:hypothetical protein
MDWKYSKVGLVLDTVHMNFILRGIFLGSQKAGIAVFFV